MKALFHRWNVKIFPFIFLLLFSPAWVFSQSIPFETIDIGEISHFRYGDPFFHGAEIVIRELGTWKYFWKIHTQGIVPRPPLPVVDFTKEMVISVILGFQPSGGGAKIEITSIELLSNPLGKVLNGIRVTVMESMEDGPLTVITNPYHIVKVGRRGTVMIEHQPFGYPCEDNSNCSIEEYCEKKPGDCVGMGVCKEKPDVCPCIWIPVCGCDGKTYGNECTAAQHQPHNDCIT